MLGWPPLAALFHDPGSPHPAPIQRHIRGLLILLVTVHRLAQAPPAYWSHPGYRPGSGTPVRRLDAIFSTVRYLLFRRPCQHRARPSWTPRSARPVFSSVDKVQHFLAPPPGRSCPHLRPDRRSSRRSPLSLPSILQGSPDGRALSSGARAKCLKGRLKSIVQKSVPGKDPHILSVDSPGGQPCPCGNRRYPWPEGHHAPGNRYVSSPWPP